MANPDRRLHVRRGMRTRSCFNGHDVSPASRVSSTSAPQALSCAGPRARRKPAPEPFSGSTRASTTAPRGEPGRDGRGDIQRRLLSASVVASMAEHANLRQQSIFQRLVVTQIVVQAAGRGTVRWSRRGPRMPSPLVPGAAILVS